MSGKKSLRHSSKVRGALTKKSVEQRDARRITAKEQSPPEAVEQTPAYTMPLEEANAEETKHFRHATGFRSDFLPYHPVEDGGVQQGTAATEGLEFAGMETAPLHPPRREGKIIEDPANPEYTDQDQQAEEQARREAAIRAALRRRAPDRPRPLGRG